MANPKNVSANTTITDADRMAQRIAELEAELAQKNAASVAKPGELTLKITAARAAGTNGANDKGSKGGGLSIYGLQRFPVTLYAEQWARLAEHMPQVLAFIEANKDKLNFKASA